MSCLNFFGDDIVIGNLGSHLIFSFNNGQIINLSSPHKISEDERNELETKGGVIKRSKSDNELKLEGGYRFYKGIGYLDVNKEREIISSFPDIVRVSGPWQLICLASKFFANNLNQTNIVINALEALIDGINRKLNFEEAVRNSIVLILKASDADFVKTAGLVLVFSKKLVDLFAEKNDGELKKLLEKLRFSSIAEPVAKVEVKVKEFESKLKISIPQKKNKKGCCDFLKRFFG